MASNHDGDDSEDIKMAPASTVVEPGESGIAETESQDVASEITLESLKGMNSLPDSSFLLMSYTKYHLNRL